jgi:hypothetical protein
MPTEEQRKPAFDMRRDGEAFCADCPDHEACMTGWPCWKVKTVAKVPYMRNEDGSWVEAEPIPFIGWKAKTGDWFFRWGFPRMGRFMAWWDELGLGK